MAACPPVAALSGLSSATLGQVKANPEELNVEPEAMPAAARVLDDSVEPLPSSPGPTLAGVPLESPVIPTQLYADATDRTSIAATPHRWEVCPVESVTVSGILA